MMAYFNLFGKMVEVLVLNIYEINPGEPVVMFQYTETIQYGYKKGMIDIQDIKNVNFIIG